eukprot:CAMPEP_0170563816 /NCGR_PEP_ID=MMETSP0211-20121228/69041_1 /TAXON_ID=311385 /ORGANISM="Pseudokeronopsis sp., Strain OXSARD2" /LENGTH=109 /DNA_ID=CAMNT_0010882495 /DNA_START=29 /DNA_END=356 /DNA_ORIENTATION=-
MYIFKNPRIGDVVLPHKDNSYMFTDPLSTQGIWVGLDDASESNGCLWGIPGSHKKDPKFDITGAVPIEVKAGSIVLIHGNLLHFSHKNTSEVQRHSYVLHMAEGKEGVK